MIGTTVGNYKILEALGEGGVGMVYKGVDTMLDREVAIKVLRPELARQTSVVERFRSEAVTLAKLSHPNIATLFSLFRQNEDLIMVLEFVRGEPLETVIQERGRLSVEETIPIYCQALDGINHAHEVGIIHRDIKPSNMILTDAGTLKVLDFGIARLLGTSRMTRVGNIIGTLEYMSPEQVRGEETDARSDIYSLGMMLYEMLTGRLPFETDNEFALMKMQTEQMPAPPRQLNPDIPVEIEDAIMRAVAKDADERFQNAGEFLQTLLSVDIPLASGKQFGFNSLFQAKFNTRPSKPGIEKSEQFLNAEKTAILNKKEFETAENTPVDVNKTAELAYETANEMPPNLQDQKTEILPVINLTDEQTEAFTYENPSIKETRLGASAGQTPNQKEIKETRLGVSVAPTAPAANTIKATRFGGAGNDGGITFENEVSAGSSKAATFLEKLTWVHYAGAGALAFVLFGIIGLAAVVPFLLSGNDKKTNANTAVAETVNKVETAEPKTETAVSQDETPARSDASSFPSSLPGTSESSVPGGNANVMMPVDSGENTPDDKPKDRAESKGKKETKTKQPDAGKKNTTKPPPPPSTRSQPPPTNTRVRPSGTPDLTVN